MQQKDKRIIDLTVAELIEIIDSRLARTGSVPQDGTKKSQGFLRGVSELATYLNISLSSASNLVKTGKVDKATHRIGRLLYFDAEVLDKLF